MQRTNNDHRQHSLFGFDGTLSATALRRLETSRGAPSCAVNCLVGAIILQHLNNCSVNDLLQQIQFVTI